ncbi:MAG TPA: adenosylcobinamide-GDP ribazoletransferase [Eubacteriaceae bacterium]|nr:adenosylcobinamide-GDP ribazoletransferase [Eubacteriaceae bacterium]
MRLFLIALSFFTRIPIQLKKEVTTDDFYRSMKLIAFVGMVVGGVLYMAARLTESFDPPVTAVFLIVVSLFLTGGIHLDGYMDSLDGMLSNRPKEEVFQIMKDSRVGAFGAIGMVLLLLVYFVFFQFVSFTALLLMPVVGRGCAVLSASMTRYAKENKQLGGRFVDDMTFKDFLWTFIFALLLAAFIDWRLIPVTMGTFALAALLTKWIEGKIDGTTGDTIGFVIESGQMMFLMIAYIGGI